MSTTTSTLNTNKKTAAIAQLCATSNKLQNLRGIAHCAGLAQQKGACMLFLPECFGFLGESAQQTLAEAEPEIIVGSKESAVQNQADVTSLLQEAVASGSNGGELSISEDSSSSSSSINLLCGLQTIARESGLWISGGGMHVGGAPPAEGSDQTRVYNTHVILDNEGEVKCLYRKIHLFDVHIPGKVDLQESKTTARGTELATCESPLGKLGLTTCYDVRFPEQYIALRKLGAEILLVPSAFTVPTGSAHWHTLLRTRAIEHQCYVLAAAQYGRHNAKRESYGHSLAVDPWGKVLADAGGCDGPGTMPGDKAITTPSIVTCEIDLDMVASIRQRMPIEQHRDAAVGF